MVMARAVSYLEFSNPLRGKRGGWKSEGFDKMSHLRRQLGVEKFIELRKGSGFANRPHNQSGYQAV